MGEDFRYNILHRVPLFFLSLLYKRYKPYTNCRSQDMKKKEINPVENDPNAPIIIARDLSSEYDTRGASPNTWRYISRDLLTGNTTIRRIAKEYRTTYHRITDNMEVYLREIKPERGIIDILQVCAKNEPYYTGEDEQMRIQGILGAPVSEGFCAYVDQTNKFLRDAKATQ